MLAKRDPSRDAAGEQGAVKYALTDFLLLTSVLYLKLVKEVDGGLMTQKKNNELRIRDPSVD